MERAAFLQRIRRRLDLGFPPNGAHPLRAIDGVPAARFETPIDDLAATLVAAVTATGGTGRIVTAPKDLVEVLRDEVGPVDRIAVSRDPEVSRFRGDLREAGIETVEADGPTAIAELTIGLTGATAAIARTGTVVVDSARAGSRTVSLLPETHVALVDAARIVESPVEFWRAMPSWYPEGPPSQIVFITGPSKSADIELNLTVGVHGPARLIVLVLADGAASAPRST